MKLLISLFFSLLLLSCASIKYPEGGPKDSVGPDVVQVKPNLPTTNFQNTKIKIYFDEYLRSEDFTKEVIFSPPLKEPAKVLTYGKKLKVILPKSLENDITYVMTLGKNIKDFHEGNSMTKNSQFAFTKSNQLDSCSISGSLISTYPGFPLKNYVVMLFEKDSIINFDFQKKSPRYFAYTEDDGSFQLNYLKQDNYYIMAVQDKDNNLQWNMNDENIASEDTILIDFSSSKKISKSLMAFPYDKVPPKIKKIQWKDSLTLAADWSEPVVKIQFNSNVSHVFIHKKDKSEIFFQQLKNDSIFLEWKNVIDTAFNQTDTSVKMFISKTQAVPKLSFSPPEISIQKWKIKSNVALNKGQENLVTVQDTNKNFILMPVTIQENEIVVSITQELDTSQVYDLRISKDFQSFHLTKPDSTILFQIKPKSKEMLAKINFEIQCDYGNFYGILTNKDTKEIFNFTDKNHRFTSLEPGKYELTIIDDRDGNQMWTTGSFFPYREPEKIYIHSSEILLKPGFEIEKYAIEVKE